MSTKIFVGNLNFQATEQELQDFLASYGVIQEVFMPKDRETGRPRGFAFVTFEDDTAAKKALEDLNGKEFAGRPLTVNEARAKEERSGPRPPRRDFGPSAPRGGFGGGSGGGSRGGFGGPRRDFGGRDGGRGRDFGGRGGHRSDDNGGY